MGTILVIAEHFNGALSGASSAAVGFASLLVGLRGGKYEILVIGSSELGVTNAAARLGASAVLIADLPVLREPLADNYAQVIAEVCQQRQANTVVGAASSFTKDVLPRAAALLDAGMLSDVVEVRSEETGMVYCRGTHAGSAIATVRLEGPIQVFTIRGSAFRPPATTEAASEVLAVAIDEGTLPQGIRFVSRERKAGGRPDPTEARIVVSGGRAIKTAADFERLVGGLADVLGGAVGSSRALVDSGIAANSLQVGQTGKVVAPDLYVALGISGAIQHLAGMKDSKVIVAINKDASAPIFEIADYGLVADIYEAVPEMIAKLKAR